MSKKTGGIYHMEYKKLRNQWNRRVQEFKQSNKNISEWCKENGINPSTFRYWLDKDKATKVKTSVELEQEEIKKQSWMAVEIVSNKAVLLEETITIKVGSAVVEVKEGFSKNLLQDIVKVLVASC